MIADSRYKNGYWIIIILSMQLRLVIFNGRQVAYVMQRYKHLLSIAY
jgi:short subunit fatty acids transporter